MAEYLEREALLKSLTQECKDCDNNFGYDCEECDYAHAMLYVRAEKAADVQPKATCRMIPFEPDCRGYTDVFICTNCQLHIHLGFISKNYGGNFCLVCGAEVKDGEQND